MPSLIIRTIFRILLPGAATSCTAFVCDPFAIATSPQHLLGHLLGRQPRKGLLPHTHFEETVAVFSRILFIYPWTGIGPTGQFVNVLLTRPVQMTNQLLAATRMTLLVPNSGPVCVRSGEMRERIKRSLILYIECLHCPPLPKHNVHFVARVRLDEFN